MVTDRLKTWDSDLVDCPSTTVAKKVAFLRGGESITLKSEAAVDSYHFIGQKHIVEAGRGYKLWGGETMTIDLKPEFGMNNRIEIWAIPGTAGEDVTWFKVKGSTTEGLVAIERMKKYLTVK